MDCETGASITNALIKTGFTQKADPWGLGVGKSTRVKEQVNSDGIASFEGKSIYDERGGSVFADGYYSQRFGMKYKKNRILNRWEPWNPMIEVRMRPKKNPVPMVYDGIDKEDIPTWNEPIGFDLEIGDWTAPHGKGKRKDMLFLAKKKSYQGAEIHISFPNEQDGVQTYLPPENLRSEFIFPYLAPTNGYMPKLFKEKWYASAAADPESNIKGYNEINYIFRVRTKADDEGNILSANYGRIRGDVKTSSTGRIYFHYWFNPAPNNRSLESLEKPY